jgi:FkbM family methyltransferase
MLRTQALPVVLHYSGVDPLNFVQRGIGIGNYETEQISGEKFLVDQVLPRLLTRKHTVLFDVGANVGHYSKSLSSAFPSAQILAFEPVPQTFESLRARLTGSLVKCYPVGLSDAEGSAIIYDYDQAEGSEHASLFSGVFDLHRAKKIKEIHVPLITMDAFCAAEQISEIDFLKIDTEGNELRVLKGAQSLISKRAIRAIQFEFNEMNVVSRVFLRDFYDILPGYTFYRLLPEGLLPLGQYSSRNEIFAFQNILAVNDAAIDKSVISSFVSNPA